MAEHFHIVKSSEPPQLTTVSGLKNEVYTATLRYFAPVVAIAREFSATAGIATAWWRSSELQKDHAEKRG